MMIERIDPKTANQMAAGEITRRGVFLCKEGERWVAIDNRTGDCWVEDFHSKGIAAMWLFDYLLTDEAHAIDNELAAL